VIQRIYVDEASLTARYPLSTTKRVEVGVSANRQTFGVQSVNSVVVGNQVIGQSQGGASSTPAVHFGQARLAYVGDYSSFGPTSPVAGGRYRFEVAPVFGDLTFGTVMADYRRYLFARPVTLALRGIHYGRYGADAENAQWMQPLFLGYSSLVRGYSANSFTSSECTAVAGNAQACPEFDRLLGSRLAVANAELRIPLFGPRQFALIPAFLPTEIAPFLDAGVAWTRAQSPTLNSASATGRTPVVSAGVSTRMNLFGAFVLEVYYAVPFQRTGKGGQIGFQLLPGW
jgi:hypothetical protein